MSGLGLPINPNPVPPPGETYVNIYGYTPWLALGIVSLIIFGAGLLCHLAYAVRAGIGKRRRSQDKTYHHESELTHGLKPRQKVAHILTFEILFSFGCAFEVVGYAFRTKSSKNPFVLISFVLNYFFIVVAPVFFSAAQYYCLSVLLRLRSSYAELLPLSGRKIVAIFVAADVITIIIQVAGAALIGVSESALANNKVPPLTPEQANDILRAGLAVQVFFITIFLSLLGLLLTRLVLLRRGSYQRESEKGSEIDSPKAERVWMVLGVLIASSIFIYIRTVFRLVEAAAGVNNTALLNQGLFAALETVPVLLAVILWTVLPLQFLLKGY